MNRNSYNAPVAPPTSQQAYPMPADNGQPSQSLRKRSRPDFEQPQEEQQFVTDPDANSDDDEDDGKDKDKKAGRRKIKIEYIADKSRRHITFSKRKAGIMKKAYELSTLTGTQVLLLVVSETGLVYTFTTAKLQPLVTQPEGKNLIQACLNAPHGAPPSSMPPGQPISRSNPQTAAPASRNVPGSLGIGGGGGGGREEHADGGDQQDDNHPAAAEGRNTRRRQDQPNKPTSPSSPNVPHAAGGQMAIPQGSYPYQQSSPNSDGGYPPGFPYGAPYQQQQQHAQRPVHGGQAPQPQQHWPQQATQQAYGR